MALAGFFYAIKHGPQNIEFELENLKRTLLLRRRAEMIQRDSQAMFNIAARQWDPVAEIR
ncbi:MAG: hypothetical protein RLZZ271_607 [Pseudomonadota bacterium]